MKIERIVLSILSMLPMKAVAYAAASRLTTLDGKDTSAKSHWDTLLKEKAVLFGPMELMTTQDKAYERFLNHTGLQNSVEAESAFNAIVEKMLRDGTIQIDEKLVISKIPSWG